MRRERSMIPLLPNTSFLLGKEVIAIWPPIGERKARRKVDGSTGKKEIQPEFGQKASPLSRRRMYDDGSQAINSRALLTNGEQAFLCAQVHPGLAWESALLTGSTARGIHSKREKATRWPRGQRIPFLTGGRWPAALNGRSKPLPSCCPPTRARVKARRENLFLRKRGLLAPRVSFCQKIRLSGEPGQFSVTFSSGRIRHECSRPADHKIHFRYFSVLDRGAHRAGARARASAPCATFPRAWQPGSRMTILLFRIARVSETCTA